PGDDRGPSTESGGWSAPTGGPDARTTVVPDSGAGRGPGRVVPRRRPGDVALRSPRAPALRRHRPAPAVPLGAPATRLRLGERSAQAERGRRPPRPPGLRAVGGPERGQPARTEPGAQGGPTSRTRRGGGGEARAPRYRDA